MYSMLPFASLATKHIKIIQEPDGLVVKCSGTARKPIPKQKNLLHLRDTFKVKNYFQLGSDF